MPAKGKHRRTKAQRLTRSIAVAGTGGAALALPFLGATGAHAATPQSAPATSVQSLSVTGQQAKADKGDDTRTYTVKAGDYLAKIAEAEHVDGGWKQLYADNREAVGDDPSLIHPGLKLSVDGKAAAKSAPKQSASPQAAKPAAPKAEKPAEQPVQQAAEESSSNEASAQTAPSSGFTSPVPGGGLGTAYKVAGSMWSSGYHTGVDFSVPTGTSLKAVGAGTVVSAGWGGAYGNQVVIQLNDGHYAQYAHLSSLSVSAGQTVSAGQQVGLSGATGNVTGPHLHFEIRTGPDYGSDVDPVSYLRSKGVSI
ncbi:peptidoglycan DD-metalloendopeptidase family protein [Streptomyces albogriseolus]|uniref:M23 family metallopeptidase n=2 Tax=Streptomyces albogriseolus group TaxID=2867120 RepID=A0ABP6TL87_9ACTN|nr:MULTISPECIES: M23 family metallopeptidase [Streptomyces]MCX4570461.1 peptidoglycan DD-metalloendopeptidase family protein [Streptomyces viridodiastaticus]NIL54309.1 peptidoglycan DD-metalloendopeptidase family protein [Streptomyces sp. 2BBP-J2]GHB85654.1 peptidase [Streptomyces albogriseolus]GHG03158.1 peptidase [Streptomyces viridodiastaticus]